MHTHQLRVYLSGDDGQLFYRNLLMADRKAHNAGLGINHFTRQLKPFYRDGLLLNGSNMGVWEIPFLKFKAAGSTFR
ncbi:MAG: hypothetical protein U0T81_10975 [Saprospiraceae bacterium]